MILLAARVPALLSPVCPHEGGPSEGALDGGLVHDDRVLHVVPLVRQDRHDEVLSSRSAVETDEFHRLGGDERLLRIVEHMAPRVWPDPVVGRAQAERLLGHPRTHRDPGAGVVLRIGHHCRANAEYDHGVGLEVRVLRVQERIGLHEPTARLALERDLAFLARIPPVDIHDREDLAAVLALLGCLVGRYGDVGILLLLGVGPFDDALADEVGPPRLAGVHVLDVLAREHRLAIANDEQRAPEPPLVAVDYNLVHVDVESYVDLRRQQPGATPLAYLLHQLLRLVVQAYEVAVRVNPCFSGLMLADLPDAEVPQQPYDLLLVRAFGHVDDQRAVLDKTTVLTLRGLVGTEPAPLRRVQIPGLEVRLAPRQRGRDPPQMR